MIFLSVVTIEQDITEPVIELSEERESVFMTGFYFALVLVVIASIVFGRRLWLQYKHWTKKFKRSKSDVGDEASIELVAIEEQLSAPVFKRGNVSSVLSTDMVTFLIKNLPSRFAVQEWKLVYSSCEFVLL